MKIALMPLSPALHVGALQHLYRATPGYWNLYQYSTVPAGQAANDIRGAAETPGRYLMGVIQPPEERDGVSTGAERQAATDTSQGRGELIGLVDFRLDWPEAGAVYIGMFMIAERYQRQGLGTVAWQLLRPWLTESAGMAKVRLRVEQFNSTALRFFESLGFQLTGNATRVNVNDQLVRLLDMEHQL
ncbi:MAG: GNAT family N-acetyltransferase [Caldilineaceae bacterium]|nr:GNAT family N-acetyltransferase [Caldilineaceae bacterium]